MTDTPTAGDALRRLADILDAAPEPIPADALGSLFLHGIGNDVRAAWAALRGVVTDPGTTVEVIDSRVRVTAPGLPVLAFMAGQVGSRRTVTREVTEYVLDDAAVSA